MSEPIRITIDVTNPGQFFACCGLLELAARLWADSCGRFAEVSAFEIVGAPTGSTIQDLIKRLYSAELAGALTPALAKERDELESEWKERKKSGQRLTAEKEERRKHLGGLLRAGSVTIGAPFNLVMDWWEAEGDEVPKTWAGSMQVRRVARAALAQCREAFVRDAPFGYSCVLRPVDDEEGEGKAGETEDEGKAEPFYFDSTRGSNATPLDIGFSPNKLTVPKAVPTRSGGKMKVKQVKMESAAFPAVEFLALVGLQRFRPMPTRTPRVFDYCTWTVPLPASVAAAAACGLLAGVGGERYRFENAFRTDQRKHKGFLPATRTGEEQ